MKEDNFVPLDFKFIPENNMIKNSQEFLKEIKRRRTVREFSDKPVPMSIIENCIKTAGTAPSGANLQPWHFVVVTDENIKRRIRIEAEKEEKEFYNKRAPKEWLDALKPLGTDSNKPFLETAPILIAIFSKSYDVLNDGSKVKHYYAQESTGIACGFLITAIHHAGLASLTHTPSPMKFLNKILNRPNYEKPFLLLVVGYPAENTKVPNVSKKPLEQICTFL